MTETERENGNDMPLNTQETGTKIGTQETHPSLIQPIFQVKKGPFPHPLTPVRALQTQVATMLPNAKVRPYGHDYLHQHCLVGFKNQNQN